MTQDLNRLGPDALTVKRIRLVLTAVVVGLALGAAVGAWLVVPASPIDLPGAIPIAAAVVWLVWTAVAWVWAGVDHRRWAWRLDSELLEVRNGVLVRRSHLIPRNRIQNVTTTNGPIQTRFGVATLTVHTAGIRTPDVKIRDIDAGHAERIRRRLGLI